MPSIGYRLLYSYVDSFRFTKITYYSRLLKVIKHLSPLKVAIDIGAGYGIASDLIHLKVGTLYLVEKDTSLLERIRSRTHELRNVEIILADALKLPFTDDFADLVYFHDSFDEISNKALALKEAARVIRQEGYLALLDWDKGRLITRIKEVLLRRMGFQVDCWSLEEVMTLVKGTGMRIIVAGSNMNGSMTILAKKEKTMIDQ